VKGKAIKPKDRCCKSRPRCDRCPVVLRRLEAQGLAKRSKGRYVVTAKVKKKQLKAARI
jgi:hypothetical protein